MTTTTGNTRQYSPAASEHRMQLALHDEAGLLTLRRLRPWHRMLARCAAARLDRELAAGISPEASAILTARAMQLTSMKFRRDLARSGQRILAVAAVPADVACAACAGQPGADQPVGPLYHDARGADLADIIGTAVQVLTV